MQIYTVLCATSINLFAHCSQAIWRLPGHHKNEDPFWDPFWEITVSWNEAEEEYKDFTHQPPFPESTFIGPSLRPKLLDKANRPLSQKEDVFPICYQFNALGVVACQELSDCYSSMGPRNLHHARAWQSGSIPWSATAKAGAPDMRKNSLLEDIRLCVLSPIVGCSARSGVYNEIVSQFPLPTLTCRSC